MQAFFEKNIFFLKFIQFVGKVLETEFYQNTLTRRILKISGYYNIMHIMQQETDMRWYDERRKYIERSDEL